MGRSFAKKVTGPASLGAQTGARSGELNTTTDHDVQAFFDRADVKDQLSAAV